MLKSAAKTMLFATWSRVNVYKEQQNFMTAVAEFRGDFGTFTTFDSLTIPF